MSKILSFDEFKLLGLLYQQGSIPEEETEILKEHYNTYLSTADMRESFSANFKAVCTPKVLAAQQALEKLNDTSG